MSLQLAKSGLLNVEQMINELKKKETGCSESWEYAKAIVETGKLNNKKQKMEVLYLSGSYDVALNILDTEEVCEEEMLYITYRTSKWLRGRIAGAILGRGNFDKQQLLKIFHICDEIGEECHYVEKITGLLAKKENLDSMLDFLVCTGGHDIFATEFIKCILWNTMDANRLSDVFQKSGKHRFFLDKIIGTKKLNPEQMVELANQSVGVDYFASDIIKTGKLDAEQMLKLYHEYKGSSDSRAFVGKVIIETELLSADEMLNILSTSSHCGTIHEEMERLVCRILEKRKKNENKGGKKTKKKGFFALAWKYLWEYLKYLSCE